MAAAQKKQHGTLDDARAAWGTLLEAAARGSPLGARGSSRGTARTELSHRRPQMR